MAYTLAPWFAQQFFDDNGDPLAGGLVTSYLSQSTTLTPTYRDGSGTPNTNPVVLDASGRAVMYLDALTYKLVLTDALGTPVGPTLDPVTSAGLAGDAGLGAVFAFGGQSSAPVTATAMPSGGTYDTLHPGTAVFRADPATLLGTYVLEVTGLTSDTNVLAVTIVNLDLAPDTPLAAPLGISSTTGAVGISGPIAFGIGGLVRNFGIKAWVSAGTAFCWGVTLIRRT